MYSGRNFASLLDSGKSRARLLAFGLALFCAGAFLELAWELHEDAWIDSLDREILYWLASHRIGAMNGIAVDITSLGSVTTITIFTLIGTAALLLRGQRFSSMYLALGTSGAGLLTAAMKHLFQRPRPDVPRLVEVAGYSFPSGHTLSATAFYLLVMFLLWPHFKGWPQKFFLVGAATLVIGCVAGSRVYLGAHYPTDVLGGVFLGAAWTFLVTGFLISPRITKL